MKIVNYDVQDKTFILESKRRKLEKDPGLVKNVAVILEEVREKGRAACVHFTKEFDGIDLDPEDLLVCPEDLPRPKILQPETERAWEEAEKNIRRFHQKQKPGDFEFELAPGHLLGERWIPLDSVGCYVPGGTAPLVSTVLMTVIPAQIAGVESITVCTPPLPGGDIHPFILSLCQKLRVKQILKLGGAQAIASLAYGFPGFPGVDKIVGPGNCFVTEAKRQLYGTVGLDMLAGPTEVCILADETASSAFIAADLLSQLEHDSEAVGTVVCSSKKILEEIPGQIESQLKKIGRKTILRQSLENVRMIFVRNNEEGYQAVDQLAPEHLEIMLKGVPPCPQHPFKSGALFLGNYSPVVLGDLFGGTNHVLPTGGRAVFSSPLSVYDFFRRSHTLYFSEENLKKSASKVEALAETEELPAHKHSVSIRTEKV